MNGSTHFLFNAWMKSTKDNAVTLTIKQLGKSALKVTTTVGELMNHIKSFNGVPPIDIEVHSLTTTKKGKPELVYCGVVFEAPKMTIGQRLAQLNAVNA